MKSKKSEDDNKFNDVYTPTSEDKFLVHHYWKRSAMILIMILSILLGYIAYDYSVGRDVPEPVVKFHLIKFINNIRGLCNDPVVIRQRMKTAYFFTTSKSKSQIDKLFKDIELKKKLHDKKTVLISKTTIKRKLKSLYSITWVETGYQNSKVVSVLHFEAFLRLEFLPVGKEKNSYLVNPSGIFINNIVINKISKPKLDS